MGGTQDPGSSEAREAGQCLASQGGGKNWDFILCGRKPVQSLRPPMKLSCLKLVKRLPWLLDGYDAIREQEWKLRVHWVASAVILARRDGPWWGQWVRG